MQNTRKNVVFTLLFAASTTDEWSLNSTVWAERDETNGLVSQKSIWESKSKKKSKSKNFWADPNFPISLCFEDGDWVPCIYSGLQHMKSDGGSIPSLLPSALFHYLLIRWEAKQLSKLTCVIFKCRLLQTGLFQTLRSESAPDGMEEPVCRCYFPLMDCFRIPAKAVI